jgi:hypothetical protein
MCRDNHTPRHMTQDYWQRSHLKFLVCVECFFLCVVSPKKLYLLASYFTDSGKVFRQNFSGIGFWPQNAR